MVVEILETILTVLVEVGIRGFELIGAIIIIVSGIRGLVHYLQHDNHTQMVLFKGLSMGLGFFLGSEVLHTIIARTFSELLLVGGIIVLRIALTFLMHWEMKAESAEDEKEMIRQRRKQEEVAEDKP